MAVPAAPCLQAAEVLSSRSSPGLWDPFTQAVELVPPEPRPPDPPQPSPSGSHLAFTNPLTVGWNAFDLYWWSLLVLTTGVDDASYAQRCLFARGPYTRFNLVVQPPDSLILQMGWARQSDRFVVWIGGTANEQQALQYVLTHALGAQVNRPIGWVNATFAAQAVALAALVRADWVAEGRPPLLIAGHSYGAAVAPVLLFELLDRAPTLYDRVVTLASPKVATRSVKDSLAVVQYLRFANRGDPITIQPPPAAIVQGFFPPVSIGNYPGGDYVEANAILELSPVSLINTVIGYTFPSSVYYYLLAQLVSGALDFTPHFARRYVDTIRPNVGLKGLPDVAGWVDFASLQELDDDLRSIGL